MCIYKNNYKNGGKGSQKFWDYIATVHSECVEGINEDCSRYGHKEADLSWDKTQECIYDSWSTPDYESWVNSTATNYMIDNDVRYWAKYGSNLFPSIVINNSTYRGQMETNAVFNAICAAFTDPPRMCRKLLAADDIEHNLRLGQITLVTGWSPMHVATICLFMIGGLFVFLYCYRRHAKREMNKQMNV